MQSARDPQLSPLELSDEELARRLQEEENNLGRCNCHPADEALARVLQEEEDRRFSAHATFSSVSSTSVGTSYAPSKDEVIDLTRDGQDTADIDFQLALKLEAEELGMSGRATSASDGLSNAEDGVDLFDPNPDLQSLFMQFNHQYFYGKLDSVECRWAPRMTLCAGKCYYYTGGYCSVRLSEPLLKFRPQSDMIDTLLHEMIRCVFFLYHLRVPLARVMSSHTKDPRTDAYLFVTQNDKDRDGHGEEFQKHMRRINEAANTNITIYHSFHDEVNHYRVHVWRCDGPCQNRPPFFGYVRRSMNRKPQAADSWFAEHQKNCGGTFIKISGPEDNQTDKGKGKGKRKKDEMDKTSSDSLKKQKRIEEFFDKDFEIGALSNIATSKGATNSVSSTNDEQSPSTTISTDSSGTASGISLGQNSRGLRPRHLRIDDNK